MTEPNPVSTIGVGTLNVCSLRGKLDSVLSLATQNSLDILCLQEARICKDDCQTVRKLASDKGWSAHIGTQNVDAASYPYAGTIILSSWPTETVDLPQDPLFIGRAVAVKVYRPNLRPCILINSYLHASDSELASHTAEALFEWASSTGEQWMIAGDFNLSKAHWPMSLAIAAGRLCDVDSLVCEPSAVVGTTRRPNGSLTRNVIDYMLTTKDLVVATRSQLRGVADHDLIAYRVVLNNPVDCYKWPPLLRLKVSSIA